MGEAPKAAAPATGLRARAILALQALLTATVIAWVLDLQGTLGIELYTEQFLVAVLGLALGLCFLVTMRSRWDPLLTAAGLVLCGYVAWRYPVLVNLLSARPPEGIALSAALALLVMEGVRRTAGFSLVAITLVGVAYALLGDRLPGVFQARPVALSRLLVYLGLDTNALLGAPLAIAASVVIPFVLLGQVLARCGGSEFFTDLARAWMGRYRGGAAKIAVVGSALFGTISGSAVANVTAVGIVSIPLMKRSGFPPTVAAAIEAVGSTGGQLMPPVMGAAAFLMAEVLQVPYSAVLVAAAIPAVLYYLALFFQVDLEAAKRGILGEPRDQLPRIGEVLRAGWYFPLPFGILFGGLIWWNLRAEYAALLATAVLAACALAFGFRGRRLTVGELLRAAASTGSAVLDLVLVCALAGMFIGILNITSLAFGLTLQLTELTQQNVVVLLGLTALVAIVLGMGLPTVGVYVIMATLVAPALAKAGIAPLAAHLFLLYFGIMSMVTPPVALAAFAAANIGGTDPNRTGWTAARIGWSAYIVPFLFVSSPSLLMQGSPAVIAWAFATAAAGIWMGTIGVVGFYRRRIEPWARALFILAGIALLIPADAFAGAVYTDVAGLLLGGGLLLLELRPKSEPGARPESARR